MCKSTFPVICQSSNMEKPCKKIKLYSGKTEFSGLSNSSIGFECLPNEILEKIFGYLNIRDLCLVKRVCVKWYEISRTPVFWKKVDVNIDNLNVKRTRTAIFKLIEAFPSCVTHFKIDNNCSIYKKIYLTELLSRLQERCPSLKVFILDNAKLEYCPGKGFSMSHVLESLQQLRVLALQHSTFKFDFYFSARSPCASRIEVLDVARSYAMAKHALVLASMLPHLKELRLAGCTLVDKDFEGFYHIFKGLHVLDLEGTLISSKTYTEIWNKGQYLTELYLCGTQLQDSDIKMQSADSFPKLETLCIRGTYVTEDGIRMLMIICYNLKCLYTSWSVSDKLLIEFFNCSSKKLHYDNSRIYCDHFKKVNYMLEY